MRRLMMSRLIRIYAVWHSVFQSFNFTYNFFSIACEDFQSFVKKKKKKRSDDKCHTAFFVPFLRRSRDVRKNVPSDMCTRTYEMIQTSLREAVWSDSSLGGLWIDKDAQADLNFTERTFQNLRFFLFVFFFFFFFFFFALCMCVLLFFGFFFLLFILFYFFFFTLRLVWFSFTGDLRHLQIHF